MILETTAVIGLAAVRITCYGILLGIGFWGSKKITNKLDEVLLLYDKRELERLAKEIIP